MNNHKIPILHKTDTNITIESGKVISYQIHIHSYCEILLYEPFDGYIRVNDRIITPDNLTAILIIPVDFHEIVVNGNSDATFKKIFFTSNIFEKTIFPKKSMLFESIDANSLFLKTYNEIIQNPANEHFKKILTQVIIYIIVQNGQVIEMKQATNSNNYSSEAIRIINEKYDENLTLSSVAKFISITPQYLSNIFKETIGITFCTYLTAIRLQHAEKLLIETNESVTDICDMCGYENFSHFIRSFKKKYGISPSVYRKNRR